jgi:hypothetical protein
MRTALFNLKSTLASYIPKGISSLVKHPYEYLQSSVTYTLKTTKDYLLSYIINLPKTQTQTNTPSNINPPEEKLNIPIIEDTPLVIQVQSLPIKTPSNINPPEEKLLIPIIEDTPLNIQVQSLPIKTAMGILRKKNILPAKLRNLTWKNNTRIPDSIIIEAKKYWEDNCGIQFTQVEEKPWFTFEEASENLEKHPDLQYVVAMAFFPGDEKSHTVQIFKRFDSQFNKIAALAHELGHIMGFCHEIDPKNMHCSNEVNHFTEYITEYDPNSIMYYGKLWEDEKNLRLTKLSDLDIEGCRKLYGEPKNGSKALQLSR